MPQGLFCEWHRINMLSARVFAHVQDYIKVPSCLTGRKPIKCENSHDFSAIYQNTFQLCNSIKHNDLNSFLVLITWVT